MASPLSLAVDSKNNPFSRRVSTVLTMITTFTASPRSDVQNVCWRLGGSKYRINISYLRWVHKGAMGLEI